MIQNYAYLSVYLVATYVVHCIMAYIICYGHIILNVNFISMILNSVLISCAHYCYFAEITGSYQLCNKS